MKITDRIKRKETDFYYVEAGTVFKYDKDYYMATEEITDSYEDTYNCVNLDSGELYHFDNDNKVEVLEAELIVK